MSSAALMDLLAPEAVCLNLQAKSAKEVIETLGGKLQMSGYARDTFVEAAWSREQVMPTGLPLAGEINAAIPHCDIEHVIKPAVALATLAENVTFQNMIIPEEGVPCRLVFLLALEQPKAQVEMLQAIAGILQDPQTVEKLVGAKNLEQIRKILSEKNNFSYFV